MAVFNSRKAVWAVGVTIFVAVITYYPRTASKTASHEFLAQVGHAKSLIDITVPTAPHLPVFESASGLPNTWRKLKMSIEEGDECNVSWLDLGVHTGTHVDAPAHFLQEAMHDGRTIENLDLGVLLGPALVVAITKGTNITGEVLQALQLPQTVNRVIFKTDNTDRNLMFTSRFETSYTAMTRDGAQWLVDNTSVKLVGIDYLSIAIYKDVGEPHRILFKKGIIAVEGLDLRHTKPGMYYQTCLPAKFQGADGAPVRCILQDIHQ